MLVAGNKQESNPYLALLLPNGKFCKKAFVLDYI